ncbi:MAG: flavin reductase, partial [Oscillospiraceae bacterium]|nr:flavin reductase [Oscillospiraceae bacterium]
CDSPVSLECKVCEIIKLGSHDMFIADITGVSVNPEYLDENGRLMLENAGLVAFAHGDYFELGKKLGSFGYSVRKKKKSHKK